MKEKLYKRGNFLYKVTILSASFSSPFPSCLFFPPSHAYISSFFRLQDWLLSIYRFFLMQADIGSSLPPPFFTQNFHRQDCYSFSSFILSLVSFWLSRIITTVTIIYDPFFAGLTLYLQTKTANSQSTRAYIS